MSNASLKELLDLLDKSQEEAKSSPAQKKKATKEWTVTKFVREFNITAGPKRIHNYIIFYYYRTKYSVDPRNLLGKIGFFKILSKMFPRARVGKQRYYLLDPSSFDLSREGKLEAKYYDQAYKISQAATVKAKKAKRQKARAKKEHESKI